MDAVSRSAGALLLSGVVEELGEGEGSFVLHAGDDVLVGGQREPGGGVPEPLGNDFHGGRRP